MPVFPDLLLRITIGWPEQLLEQLRRSEIDVAAFCLPDGTNPPTEIEADALDIQPLFVVAPQSLDLPSPATLQDVSPFPWIINQDGCGLAIAIAPRSSICAASVGDAPVSAASVARVRKRRMDGLFRLQLCGGHRHACIKEAV
jgi:DNA-binding transcriptional LysR family regulator